MGSQQSRALDLDDPTLDADVARTMASMMAGPVSPAMARAFVPSTPITTSAAFRCETWRQPPPARSHTAASLVRELRADATSWLSVPVRDIATMIEQYAEMRVQTWCALPEVRTQYAGEVVVGALPSHGAYRFRQELLTEHRIVLDRQALASMAGHTTLGMVVNVSRPRIVLPLGSKMLVYTVDLWQPHTPVVAYEFSSESEYRKYMAGLRDTGLAELARPHNVMTWSMTNLPPAMLKWLSRWTQEDDYQPMVMTQQHMFRSGALRPQYVALQKRKGGRGYRVLVFDHEGSLGCETKVETAYENSSVLHVHLDDLEVCIDRDGNIVVAEYCSDLDDHFQTNVLMIRVRRFS